MKFLQPSSNIKILFYAMMVDGVMCIWVNTYIWF